MHPLLEQFLEKWVWPTAPGARGAPFRLRITEDKCLKGWEIALHSSLAEIEKGLASSSDEWQRRVALGGYAGEGVQMSIKQMSAQLLSVDLTEQEQYIDLQCVRARQVWDECKHSKLHVSSDPARTILEVEQDIGADLLVMATHGVTGLFHLLLRSLTEKMVREAHCPVLAIHQ